jgi:hypothetical protein
MHDGDDQFFVSNSNRDSKFLDNNYKTTANKFNK